MRPGNSVPRLAVVVANGITGDSRVQKAAIAAARDGWEVTLVGRSLTGKVQRTTLGPIDVVRVPTTDDFKAHAKLREGHHVRRSVTQFGIPSSAALKQHRAAHQAWLLRQRTAVEYATGLARLGAPVRRTAIAARDAVHRFRNRAWGWEQFRRPKTAPPTGDWRLDWPALVDDSLAFVPVLVDLKPDVIHSNDITTVGLVGQAVAQLRSTGHRVGWLYDAHEYVQGVDWLVAARASAFTALEREFIGRADTVVTVSDTIAELLRRDYQLARSPVVVQNAPIREVVGTAAVSVRSACGLGPEVPLLVYSGWMGRERGLPTAVEALPDLPSAHLALVAGGQSAELTGLLKLAAELGVDERVHVVPYVPQHEVPDYLSSADLGLICFRRTPNCELSLPTKLAEYLHAGLPIVTSDVRTVSGFVAEHGVGEVYRADDKDGFAVAVGKALANRDALALRITQPILDELSWETQARALVRTYRSIAARTPATTRPDIPWTVQEGVTFPPPAAPTPRALPPQRRWRRLASTGVRLGVGPANYAGQAGAFALAVSDATPATSAEVFMYLATGQHPYPADVYVARADLTRPAAQAAQVKRVIGRYTHLLADGFQPVFGRLNGDSIADDLPALRNAGVKTALLGHGSEVRDPELHLERHPYSLYRDAPDGCFDRLVEISRRNRRIARDSGLPVFVTTPDLLDDLPGATWAPLVVDVEAWACDAPVMTRTRPIVLHAPSKRWTKGTDRILPVLTDLHERHVIELRLAESVPWTDMRQMVHAADIVVDQFTTGAYGTLSCEAMAAGRPVIAAISETTRLATGGELPIVHATAETLAEAVEGLIEDREGAVKIGLRSRDFARAYHGGAWTARILAEFLG